MAVLNGQQILDSEKIYTCSVYDDVICFSRRDRTESDAPLTYNRKDAIIENFRAKSLDVAISEAMAKGAQAVARDGDGFYSVKLINKMDIKELYSLGENYWEQLAWQKELHRRTHNGEEFGPAKLIDDSITPAVIHRTTRHGRPGPNWIVF